MSEASWFLGIRGQVIARNRIALELSWPGPSTGWFALRPMEFDPDVLNDLSAKPFTDVTAQGFHTLAAAMRALSLFAEAYGTYPNWGDNQEVQLLYLARPVPADTPPNAWYDGLTIEYEYVEGGPWSCLSHDIVVHETCHAILHREKGWYSRADVETAAVTESVGDILAILSAGSYVAIRRDAIYETGGDLYGSSNVLSRFGENLNTFSYLRDATQAPPETDPDIYGLSCLLTAGIYQAMARLALSGDPQDLEGSLYSALIRVARAVFGAIRALPQGAVSVNQFASEVVRQAEPDLAEFLVDEFTAVEVDSERPPEFSFVGESRSLSKADLGDSTTSEQELARFFKAHARVTYIRQFPARRRVRFPIDRQRVLRFELDGERSGLAEGTLTTDSQGRPVALYARR